MPEYHIRPPDSTTSRGPYTPSQIASLAEAGQVDQDTLYYDQEQESWLPIVSNETLAEEVFPKKKSLTLRARDMGPPPIDTSPEDNSLNVNTMLAAAEGTTEETKHLKAKARSAEKAANLSPILLGVIFILSAVGLIYPFIDLVQTMIEGEVSWFELLAYPQIIVGGIDVLFAIACFLAATDIYPIIRFRAALGLGFFGYYAWSLGHDLMALALIVASLAIYVCSLTLNMTVMVIFGTLGILCMGYYAVMAFLI